MWPDSLVGNKIITLRRAAILAVSIVLIRLALLAIISDKRTFLPIDDSLLTLASGLATIGMLYASLHSEGKSRIAWLVLAVAQLAYTFGEAAWTVIEVVLHQNPFLSVADIGYFMFYPIFALSILILPSVPLSSRERLKILLDIGIAVSAFTLIFWAFVIAPIIASSDAFTLKLAISVAYPVMDVLLFVALMELIFRKLSSTSTTSFSVLAIGLIILLITDVIFSIQTHAGTYISGGLLDTGWLISYMLFWLAGVLQASSIPFDALAALSNSYDRRTTGAQYLSYLGIGATFSFLDWGYQNSRFIDKSIVSVAICVIFLLMFIRQKVTLDESNQLLAITQSAIIERNQADEAFRKSEDRYRAIFENTGTATVIVEDNTIISLANSEFGKLTGYSKEEIEGRISWTEFVVKEDLKRMLEQHKLRRVDPDTALRSYEFRARDRNGQIKDILLHIDIIPGTKKSVASWTDITEHKRSEEMLKASLDEKKLLLKEVHHRVKNNLQVISALLYLQSSNLTDDNIIKIFRDTQNRIKSMALIHENLYKSKDLGKVDFNEYIKQLISHLSQSYSDPSHKINFKINSNNVYLNINTAIPCGMIINELISNSLKYAFPDGKNGDVCIDLNSEGDNFKLIVSDNGVGIKGDLNIKDSKTLGFRLIDTLVKQIDGKMCLDTTNGTRCEIHFKGLK